MRVSGALLLALVSACAVPWEPAAPGENACTKCHGSAEREGDPLVQAAPPRNLAGNDDPATPGVGAHLIHLQDSATHGAVACDECHVVPQRTTSPGHDDTDGPAEVTFGDRATQGGLAPTYDVRRRCGDTYCHGPAPSQPWNQPRSSKDACGTCHGLPPPAPHPQSQACEQCHGDVVGAGMTIIAPALHVDGKVQVVQAQCNACHGSASTPAPSTGAHIPHLGGSATARALKCEQCHRVPSKPDEGTHLNGTVEVILDGGAYTPPTCTTGCHGPGGSPAWTRTGPALGCTGCHGAPPPPPHPGAAQCNLCHPNATGPTGLGIVSAALHVNGAVEVSVPASCDGCHGSASNPAPPRDTRGNTATSLLSVGAHQAHLVGTGFSRRPLCGECHVVPATTLAAGHVDGVTQVRFSGVALAGGSVPSYQAGSCANSFCHDTRPIRGGASNGGLFQTPSWTRLDGAQIQCNACHGFPPSAPHPQQTDCFSCHSTMGDAGTILFPQRHIDGRLDLQ